MNPIRPGDRGPAVQDIQRRLRALGYDLGPTGVDGVFLGQTEAALRAFQDSAGIAEDAVVGPQTWSALVDATFTLGDRVLYLRLPSFHGRDVATLQGALSALGFACGELDGIFGSFTERALVEFQKNAGLVPDGIAGDDTVGALMALRHVWDGKDQRSHSAARPAAARAAAVLEGLVFAVAGFDSTGALIAERIVNLAVATAPESRCILLDPGENASADARLVLRLCTSGMVDADERRPIVHVDGTGTLASRLAVALRSDPRATPEVVMEIPEAIRLSEHELQRAAVRVLDAVCVVFD
ncbi:MAG: peptidoglycan-binding protein [Coriobacteriia bacterium]|nr:peptidoglycan-binding protein [Coriobacteriia bacterium]